MLASPNKTTGFLRRIHFFPEFWSAVILIAWGLWNALIDIDLTDYMPYDLVTTLLTAANLEATSVVLGAAQLFFLFNQNRWGRIIVALCAGWFYCVFLISFATSNLPQPGIVFVAGYVGANAFVVGRLLRGPR